jgi:hypothetical protein
LPSHNDRKPSAFFDKNYMWYHCSGCGSSLPFIELCKELGWNDIILVLNNNSLDFKSWISGHKNTTPILMGDSNENKLV